MPAITIKDYQWRQTEKKIIIYVPLKNRPKDVNLFAMDNYMKISFPPFILELFLWGNVLEEESECTLTDTEAICSLQKANTLSDWPRLETEDISKEQKRDLRNQILEKVQSVLMNRVKSRNEKKQHLQTEAVKAQINLNTDTLNKIEALRDAHRKAAMQDFEEWRSNAEMPILQGICGKVQKNRKEYRPSLKWFKDDLGTVQSQKIDKKETKEEMKVMEKQQDESIITKESQKELIAKENTREESIIKDNLNLRSIIKKEAKEASIEERLKEPTKKETSTEEKLMEITVEKNPRKKLTITENLNVEIIRNEDFQEKENTLETKRTTTTLLNSRFDIEDDSNFSDYSESDCEVTSDKSSANRLIQEMDQKSLREFYAKMEKQRPCHDLIDKVLKNRYSKIDQAFEPSKAIPLPRRNGTIHITFSERIFPTPARESSHVMEQEWLTKQAEARRKTGFVVQDLRPEEQDPQWLKDKGDDFFKDRNYLAAISAYTHGIKISDKMAVLYINRSAAHYALGNYYRCIDDCSKALELMEPKCNKNRVSRARCHSRRGAALCKLSAPQHGIPELEAALKLDPDNESIKRDLHSVRQYFDIKE